MIYLQLYFPKPYYLPPFNLISMLGSLRPLLLLCIPHWLLHNDCNSAGAFNNLGSGRLRISFVWDLMGFVEWRLESRVVQDWSRGFFKDRFFISHLVWLAEKESIQKQKTCESMQPIYAFIHSWIVYMIHQYRCHSPIGDNSAPSRCSHPTGEVSGHYPWSCLRCSLFDLICQL